MSIRNKLLINIILLASFIIYFEVTGFQDGLDRKHKATNMQQYISINANLIAMSDNHALERGLTYSLLNADSVDKDSVDRIMSIRKAVDKQHQQIQDAIKQTYFGDGDRKLLKAMNQSYNKFLNLRQNVDRYFNTGVKDDSLKVAWITTSSDMIFATQTFRFTLAEKGIAIDPSISKLANLQHQLWIISEYAGRERAIIAGILRNTDVNNHMIDTKSLTTLSKYRGRVDGAWDTADKLMKNCSYTICDGLNDLKTVFLNDFNELRNNVYSAGLDNTQNFGISPSEWFNQSTDAINEILLYQSSVSEEIKSYTDTALNKADSDIQYYSITIIFALLFTTISLCVLIFNIGKPLKRLVSNINDIADGNTSIDIAGINKRDEIGTISQSLEILRGKVDSSFKLKMAFESVSSSVMLLDNDYHISHINPAAKVTLENAEKAIKASYTDFDINTIIGCKINSFCDFPSSVTDRITSRIKISDRSFEIDAAPIINTFGNQLGIVVEWKDITDELAEKADIEAFEEEINTVVTATTKGDFTKRISTDGRDGFLLNLSEGINQIADVSQKGLSEVKETLFALSNGDLSRVITGEYEGTFNDIKETVNETIGQLRNVLGEIQGTVNSIKAGNFTDTIDVSDKTGFLKDLSSSLNEISHVCDKGLSEVGNVLHALSDGDLSKEISGDYEGTFDQLKTTVNKTISQLRTVVSEIQSSANSVKEGDFGNNVDTANKKGFLLNLSESINDIGEVCSKGLTEVGNVLYALSKGDLSCTVDGDYKGTFEELQNTVNSTISSLKSVMGEIQDSVDIVRRGDFTKRINLNGKEGFLLELSKSLNEISEISNQGLNEIGDVLKALSNGQIDKKIVGNYEGTFLELKNLVNETIGKLRTVVNEIQDTATSVQDGDFTKRIDVEGKEGFLLDLSLSLNQIGITSARGLNEVERVLKSLSEGSLIDHMDGEYKGTFGEIKNTLNTTLDDLRDMVLKIKQAANSVNAASAEISESSTDLSKRTEVQASTLEETTAATEQLALTVKKNTMSAQDADNKASEARNIATSGEETVNNAINAMGRIQESSGKVTDIISVIDEIAFQTNLLALNAAVEAARAGEAGKGFAVVASEVRNLAGRSAAASKEIKDLINISVDEVKTGSLLVKESGDSLNNIIESVNTVADIINQIANESKTQSEGIGEVSHAISEMDQTTQQNAAMVEQSSSSSLSMNHQAEILLELTNFFKVDDGHHQQQTLQQTTNESSVMRIETSAKHSHPSSQTKRSHTKSDPTKASRLSTTEQNDTPKSNVVGFNKNTPKSSGNKNYDGWEEF